MKLSNFSAAILVAVVCFIGCSKSEKTPAQVNNDVAALLQQDKISEALKMAESAVEKSEKEYGLEHQFTAEFLETRAIVYAAKKDTDKAEADYKRAVSIITKLDGNESVEVAKIFNNLASLCYSNKNYTQAVAYYKQSLAIAEKKFSPGDPRVEAIRRNINTCEDVSAGKIPVQSAEKKETTSPAPDLVPAQVKEAALSDLSRQNIMVSGLVPQPLIAIGNEGVIFPYIAIKGNQKGMDEKIVVLFAAKKNGKEQNKYIFQQCRIVSFQSYMDKINEGGIEMLKKELMKLFPTLYS